MGDVGLLGDDVLNSLFAQHAIQLETPRKNEEIPGKWTFGLIQSFIGRRSYRKLLKTSTFAVDLVRPFG